MRKLASLPKSPDVERFRDYLYTLGITTRSDPDGDALALWVMDEDRLAEAREELAAFQQNPDDPRFQAASAAAEKLREQKLSEELAARKNRVDMKSRWQGSRRPIPVTAMLILFSLWVAVITKIGIDDNANQQFMMADWFRDEATGQLVSPTIGEVISQGQYLRWITPIFLHFGPMHLLFNMSATLAYGRAIEQRSGSLRFLGIVLTIALVSNFSQLPMSGPRFGGMSGVDFGLFGFLWMKSRFDPEYGVQMGRDYIWNTLFFAALCLTGALGPIANTAHFVGMGTGMVLAMIPVVPRIYRRYFKG